MFKKSCNTPPGHKVVHIINHLAQVTLPGTAASRRLHVHMGLRTDHVVPHRCILVHAFARTPFLLSHLGHLNSPLKTEGIALPLWGLPILLKWNQPHLRRELFHYKREGQKGQSCHSVNSSSHPSHRPWKGKLSACHQHNLLGLPTKTRVMTLAL